MDTTIFQKFYEEKTALINPTDCTKPIDNFPEVCISTFSKNIIDKFISLNSVQKIAELYTANGVNPVYKINYKRKRNSFLFIISWCICLCIWLRGNYCIRSKKNYSFWKLWYFK